MKPTSQLISVFFCISSIVIVNSLIEGYKWPGLIVIVVMSSIISSIKSLLIMVFLFISSIIFLF